MAQVLIGVISSAVSSAIKHPEYRGKQIFLGDANIAHMKNAHPDDYLKYGDRISEIIAAPDYVGINPSDSSIEFVKEYYINGDYIKLAVRATSGGSVFRQISLYPQQRKSRKVCCPRHVNTVDIERPTNYNNVASR